jgi:nucleoside-diphosphate-sugar epimerase
MKHTILGAGGSIGEPLCIELIRAKEQVRLVSRSGKTRPGAEAFKADMTSAEQTLAAVKGSDVVYLLAGLKYDSRVWAEQWPKIIRNTVEACKQANAKLIFFDNVYMYGKVSGKMTEETPYNPCSRKGAIRAEVAQYLEQEMKAGNITAAIARAADLYGPFITTNSVPFIFVFAKMLKAKKPQWLIHGGISHSFTYTLDCARALHIMAQHNEAFGRVWHVPTMNPPLTGEQFIRIAAKEFAMAPDFSVLKKWMVQMVGPFNRTIMETIEMMYQYEEDYYFDSTAFEEAFQFKPVGYAEGIKETISLLKKSLR